VFCLVGLGPAELVEACLVHVALQLLLIFMNHPAQARVTTSQGYKHVRLGLPLS
jgi:hypothetical protein